MKKTKRLIGIISAGFIGAGAVFSGGALAGIGPATAQEIEAAESDVVVLDTKWLNYSNNGNGTCTIIDFNYIAGESPTKIEIPAVIKDGDNELIVKEIDANAFAGCGLTYVRFHENSTIEKIGAYAFSGNSITKFEANGEGNPNSLPTSVKEIGDSAFRSNASLNSIYLKDVKIKEIPRCAFMYDKIPGGVTLPDTLESIRDSAFYQLNAASIKIPENVKEIEDGVFMGSVKTIDCSAHEPDSIEGAPWRGAAAKVIWKDTNGKDASYNSPFLFDKEDGIIYGLKSDVATNDYPGWDHTTGELTIPVRIDDRVVDKIAAGSFSKGNNGSTIKSVIFDSGCPIKEIKPYTFYQATNIKTIEKIPGTVTKLGSGAFRNMNSLEKLSLPGVTEVDGILIFQANVSMTEVTFGSNQLTVLGNKDHFSGCDNLKTINAKNMKKGSIAGFPWYAVNATVYWKDGEVTEPSYDERITADGDWVVDIKSNRLTGYLGSDVDLVIPTEVTVEGIANPISIKYIGSGARRILSRNTNITSFKSVTIPDGVINIAGASFQDSGIEELNIGSTVSYIGGYAFSGNNLKAVKFPNSLQQIDMQAFNSNKLTGQLIIPGNVKEIETAAFSNNPGINKILVKMYRSTASDIGAYNEDLGLYKKAPGGLISTAPWGASNAANQIYYMDEPQAVGKHEVKTDTTNNKITISYKGNTNNNFYIVKKIASASGMPAITNENYPTAQGMRNAATADMVIASKTANKIQGGNGTYKVNMTYGSQIEGSSIPNKSMPYDVEIDAFKTLTYNANNGSKPLSGSAPTAGDVYVAGYKPKLAAGSGMTIAGYTFAGWNTKADGTGTNYAAGATTFTMPNSDTILYAKWTANDNDVVYDANNGKFKDNSTKKTLKGKTDSALDKVTNYEAPTREGYGFMGWATSAGAGSSNINTVPAGGTTVYAVWKEGASTAVLDGNGGNFKGTNVTSKNISGTTNQALTATTGYEQPSRTGYTFKSWNTAADGKGTAVTALPAGSATRIYAIWQINNYTVTFNGNGGKIGSADTKAISGNYNAALTSLSGYAAPTRTGYNFKGWTTTKDNASTVIDKVPAANTTVYALWEIKSDIVVTFDANGGKFGNATTLTGNKATYNSNLTAIFNYSVPERQYYTLRGWTTTKNNASTAISKVPAANTTVYALWEANKANTDDIKNAQSAVDGAKSSAEGVVVSTDGTDVSEESQWVPQNIMAALNTAITNAENAIKKTDVTQEELANAINALNNAKKAFDDAKKPGTKEATDLQNAKDAAKAELDAIDTSVYSEENKKKVEEIIENAKKAIDEAATIGEVENIKEEALNNIKNVKTAQQERDDVDSVALSVKDAVIEKGKSVTLKATITPATAKDKTVTWKSSNTKVATVDKNGKVTGVKQGVAKITVTTNDGKKTAEANVRVLFDDVKKGHTFYNPIYWAADNGVTYGVTGTNNFAPANTVTRGQVIAFLYRMDGNPKTTGFKNKFKDVTTKSTFYNPILWGGKSQVVAGYPDGTFREKVTCTRGQIVAFIWRMAGKPEPATKKSQFKDVDKKNTFYKAILWAAEKGITVGYNDGTFRSGGNCTRGQMVAFLQRFAKQYPNKVKL